jgi:hypothetical protein
MTVLNPDIHFVGDPHGDLRLTVQFGLKYRPTAIVLLGDIEPETPLHVELKDLNKAGVQIYWISGNHDTDGIRSYQNLWESDLAENCIDGKIVEIDLGEERPVRIAGLGGVFRAPWNEKIENSPRWTREQFLANLDARYGGNTSPARFATPREKQLGIKAGLPLKHRSTIWPEDYDKLFMQQADILVTHEASPAFPTSSYGFEAIDDLAVAMGATLFHGHHHHNYVGKLSNGLPAIGVAQGGIYSLKRGLLFPGYDRSSDNCLFLALVPREDTIQSRMGLASLGSATPSRISLSCSARCSTSARWAAGMSAGRA